MDNTPRIDSALTLADNLLELSFKLLTLSLVRAGYLEGLVELAIIFVLFYSMV
jgi:hypothetical protein